MVLVVVLVVPLHQRMLEPQLQPLFQRYHKPAESSLTMLLPMVSLHVLPLVVVLVLVVPLHQRMLEPQLQRMAQPLLQPLSQASHPPSAPSLTALLPMSSLLPLAPSRACSWPWSRRLTWRWR